MLCQALSIISKPSANSNLSYSLEMLNSGQSLQFFLQSMNSCKFVLQWMPMDLTDGKSTLVQVMAWCRQVLLGHNEMNQSITLVILTFLADSPFSVSSALSFIIIWWHKIQSFQFYKTFSLEKPRLFQFFCILFKKPVTSFPEKHHKSC